MNSQAQTGWSLRASTFTIFTRGWKALQHDVLDALVDDGAEDDRNQQQERESRGGVPLEPGEAAGRDRDPGAGDAGHQGEDLRDPDRERGSETEVADPAVLRAAV